MTDTHPLDRLFDALARSDSASARECFTPDARIWHNFDCKASDVDEAVAGWEQYFTYFPERSATDVRRQDTATGVVQQHLNTVRTHEGERKAWAVCIVARIEGDRIARLDEYIDGAALFPLGEGAQTTPGMD